MDVKILKTPAEIIQKVINEYSAFGSLEYSAPHLGQKIAEALAKTMSIDRDIAMIREESDNTLQWKHLPMTQVQRFEIGTSSDIVLHTGFCVSQ